MKQVARGVPGGGQPGAHRNAPETGRFGVEAVIASDTLDRSASTVFVAPLIAEAIGRK